MDGASRIWQKTRPRPRDAKFLAHRLAKPLERGAGARHFIGRFGCHADHVYCQIHRRRLQEFSARAARRNHCFGGRRKNPTLLKMLQAQIGPASRVRRIDEFGIPSDAKEALAFAILAYQTWYRRPSNLPSATGARHPVIQGDITPGFSGNNPKL